MSDKEYNEGKSGKKERFNMPRGDQTGPMGEGAGTGRGLGPWGKDNALRVGRRYERRHLAGDDKERDKKVEFGLGQGSGLQRRGRGRRNSDGMR